MTMEHVNEAAAAEENFAEMFEASLANQSQMKKGESVRCVVVAVGEQDVVVDVGTKNECLIPTLEFKTAHQDLPSIGDEVEALVVSTDGQIRLSVLEGRRLQLWQDIEEAQASELILQATVTGEVKGGYKVDLNGLGAFMPRSEADVSSHVSYELLASEPFDVVVLESNRRQNNIVVSRKKPLLVNLQELRHAFFEKTKVNQKVTGKVKRLSDFGAFIDLGGVDALLHVSDVAWRRIEHPSEMLHVGQVVHAQVIKLNEEKGKVSISMKALQEDPWGNVAATYEAGMRVTGTVRKILDFGAVIELEPGVEGLIHRSEMSWTRHDIRPAEVLTEGDVVDVTVLEMSEGERRIRLSLKDVIDNPWESWLSEHPVGSKIKGEIKNMTEFGFFVQLTDELDGLVHIGNISWSESGDEAIKHFEKNQEVECLVLGVDIAKQRVSLGIKQLENDPFDVFLEGVRLGASVKGKVVSVQSGALMVEVAEGVEARLAKRELPREQDEPKVGDEIEAKVINANKKRRQVELSVKQLQHDEERNAVKQYASQLKQEEAPSALAIELQKKFFGKK
ncbi:MAG: 30S ribosomal protein S1 [Zetaproteobacteria bacterium CG_4_9_14_3_um_filter_49_83]|nr:MAG: 30S ribosomal protein S1 [Zetaproteobacteria bacterium CG1_02_49_23]PIQ33957.1 MAG: 30S ribosomal protein S1 [Zetaproteobacteria bacterium CG17_big_fil_post_rev_8_21_14_2_50_50_13]PIV29886.1 MAG: 30S ribosomal protein S1 [Zetaproteobacteria bacterium CG02_land_8_20_14_3_00_50_9]PIY56738.1 MAG: 30S ribosomal protein S1 [Zetaproteobacteria bacterium CG_4_10_14_0_8_um_filter_49_80]PJA35958.1 MAG: 30S ribosomal protein S1 [Zetaproteobacteria bacterium CG_4_9_14_3_um_filter_49_83]